MDYHGNLRRVVIEASEANEWWKAKEEWEVVDMEEDRGGEGTCECGKTGLVYLYTIQNFINNNVLHPIGSSCIHQFNNDKMTEQMKILDMGDKVMDHGKYEGLTYRDIYDNYRSYVEWLSENYHGGRYKRKSNQYDNLIKYYRFRKNNSSKPHNQSA